MCLPDPRNQTRTQKKAGSNARISALADDPLECLENRYLLGVGREVMETSGRVE